MTITHSFAGGKYVVTCDNGTLTALRYGKPWDQDLIGDNLVYWMLVEACNLANRVAELEKLSVTNIMLAVEPGDGNGIEVYAKSCKDVVDVLTTQAEKIEDGEIKLQAMERRAAAERWNVEADGDNVLVCFDNHEKGQPCEYVHFTRTANIKPPEVAPRYADPFTLVIQHLNSHPYNATKSECVEIVKELRDRFGGAGEMPVDQVRGARVDGDNVILSTRSNDVARRLCMQIVASLEAGMAAPKKEHLSPNQVDALFRRNCVFYNGNYEVTPGQAQRIATAIEERP